MGERHIKKATPVPVLAVGLERDCFTRTRTETHPWHCAVGSTLLQAVEHAQVDVFRVMLVQDFERVVVGDGGEEVGGARTLARLLSWSFFSSIGAVTSLLGQPAGW